MVAVRTVAGSLAGHVLLESHVIQVMARRAHVLLVQTTLALCLVVAVMPVVVAVMTVVVTIAGAVIHHCSAVVLLMASLARAENASLVPTAKLMLPVHIISAPRGQAEVPEVPPAGHVTVVPTPGQ